MASSPPLRQRRLLTCLLAAPHLAAPFAHPLGIQIAAGLMDVLPQLAALFGGHALTLGSGAVGVSLRRTRVRHSGLPPDPATKSHWRFSAIADFLSVLSPGSGHTWKRPLNRGHQFLTLDPLLRNVCWRIVAGRASSTAARQGHARRFAELLAISFGEFAEVGKSETQCGVGYRSASM